MERSAICLFFGILLQTEMSNKHKPSENSRNEGASARPCGAESASLEGSAMALRSWHLLKGASCFVLSGVATFAVPYLSGFVSGHEASALLWRVSTSLTIFFFVGALGAVVAAWRFMRKDTDFFVRIAVAIVAGVLFGLTATLVLKKNASRLPEPAAQGSMGAEQRQ